MPTSETSIITGSAKNIGLRGDDAPDRRYNALMPITAATIATGIIRAMGLTGVASGSVGGASRAIRPPGGRAGSM